MVEAANLFFFPFPCLRAIIIEIHQDTDYKWKVAGENRITTTASLLGAAAYANADDIVR